MAELGFLGLKYPEEYGGQGGDYLHDAVLSEELARCGSGGLAAGIGAHIGIATPPIWKFGTQEQKQRYLVPAIRGEKIAALGDHRAGRRLRRRRHPDLARKVDGGYVLNGSKTFITNGVRADFVVTAVKTTARGRPPRDLVPRDREGHGGLQRLAQAREARLARVRHRRARVPRTCSSPRRTCSARRTRAST